MKKILLIFSLALSLFGSSLAVSGAALAVGIDCTNPTTPKEQVECGACDAANAAGTDCQPAQASGTLSGTIKEIINVISLIAGAAAVIMIIIGGLRYITSAGNPEGAKSAKNTILYAIIGLVVIALAQLIVHFTLNTVTDAKSGSSSSSSSSGTSPSSATTPSSNSGSPSVPQ